MAGGHASRDSTLIFRVEAILSNAVTIFCGSAFFAHALALLPRISAVRVIAVRLSALRTPRFDLCSAEAICAALNVANDG